MKYEIDSKDFYTAKSIEKFKLHGFLIVRNFIDVNLIKDINLEMKQKSLEHWTQDFGGRTAFIRTEKANQENFFGVSYAQPANLYVKSVNKIFGVELLSAFNHLLGVSDGFYKDNELHIRHVNQKHIIPSHQDNFYFTLKNPVAITCYIYLNDQSKASGGLGFLPQNLPKDTEPHVKSTVEGFSSFHEPTESNNSMFYYPNTCPGDVVFHHCSTFHRAQENGSAEVSSSLSVRIFSRSNLQQDSVIKELYNRNLRFNRGDV